MIMNIMLFAFSAPSPHRFDFALRKPFAVSTSVLPQAKFCVFLREKFLMRLSCVFLPSERKKTLSL